MSEYSKTGMFNILDGSIFNSNDSFISDDLGDYISNPIDEEETEPMCLKVNNLMVPDRNSLTTL